ncbi:OmpA family protein [Solitalea koreensis]|uniref:WD40-like Beta Propeller Repeat n=1 Tax=Solitalea koreensis TaxID=543615 RepID=A0A521D6B5_9SPHI|nr:OmpA family protein [Solitalea koreensis]SMO67256.1 WD40-like Beta Propeller Repeat [Solitalea koreensis]
MKKIVFTSILLAVFMSTVYGQAELREANRQAEMYNFSDALNLYKAAWEKRETLASAKGLANCYRQLNDYKFMESWYAKVVQMEGHDAMDLFFYAEALRNNSKYAEAKLYYGKYAVMAADKQLTNTAKLIASCDSAQIWMSKPVKYSFHLDTTLNSGQGDFAAVAYQNGVVFSSDRITEQGLRKDRRFLVFNANNNLHKAVYGWTGNSYLKLYYAEMKDGVAKSPILFASNLSGDFHNGPATFSPNGDEIYFTRTRGITNAKEYTDDRSQQKNYTIKLEIYSAVFDQESRSWSAPKPFEFNSPIQYSVGDPCFSPDGKRLYFASDMPGGFGGTDLYFCERKDDGSWSNPLNLGAKINSVGNERSPSFDKKGDFYFASNGRVGMGGLDIYYCKGEKTTWTEPQNMGYPINTPQDDFLITFNNDGKSGFLSSNRFGGRGSDDIYSFVRKELKFILEGTVTNRKSGKKLQNAIVTLYDKTGNTNVKLATDENGFFKFHLAEESDYSLTAEKTNYITGRKDGISTKGKVESAILYAKLDLGIDSIEIDKAIKIENIYYDLDKWNIRADALPELDKLVQAMNDNPTMVIELASHTDSRAGDAYNMTLSKKRAQSAVDYIISKGIDKSRIIAKGYGETRPINKCVNGVPCTEDQYQQNRRTEFTILRY